MIILIYYIHISYNVKKLFLFAVLSVGMISVLALSPSIWAIVEPHITINMDPGQTTKPFTINDDSGTDVFSIGTDGSVNDLQVMTFASDSTPITISILNTISNPVILAEWHIDRGTVTEPLLIISNDPVMVGLGKRDTGTGSIAVGWYSSNDGITWSSRASTGFTFSTFRDWNTNTGEGFVQDNANYIALIAYNSDGNTSGQITDVSAFHGMVIPKSFTLTRLI